MKDVLYSTPALVE